MLCTVQIDINENTTKTYNVWNGIVSCWCWTKQIKQIASVTSCALTLNEKRTKITMLRIVLAHTKWKIIVNESRAEKLCWKCEWWQCGGNRISFANVDNNGAFLSICLAEARFIFRCHLRFMGLKLVEIFRRICGSSRSEKLNWQKVKFLSSKSYSNWNALNTLTTSSNI